MVFLDPTDLSRERDRVAQQQLTALADLPWDATNQAAVHTWFHDYFGGPPIAAFQRVHDAVATWAEIATCVAVRTAESGLDLCAPHGLADLLGGIWRRNPSQISVDDSGKRLARQRISQRWPNVTVIAPT